MLSNTPPTYLGKKHRTGPMDFHINKMRAHNLSADFMKKLQSELRGPPPPASFNDLPMGPLMNIGEMVGPDAFQQLNKSTAGAFAGRRGRKKAVQSARGASAAARRAAERVRDAERRARREQQRQVDAARRERQRLVDARYTFPFPKYDGM